MKRLSPFYHDIALPFGIRTYVPELNRRRGEATRVSQFLDHAWPAILKPLGGSFSGKKILDVACNCGGFSVAAVQSGADHVLGIDVVEKYIEQANFVKHALGLKNMTFEHRTMQSLEADRDGMFDISFCFGILYHLENPVASMRRLAKVTRSMIVVDTDIDITMDSKRSAWTMVFTQPTNEQSVSASTSLWRKERRVCELVPTEKAVIELLQFLGFVNVSKVQPSSQQELTWYLSGKRATFIGMRQ